MVVPETSMVMEATSDSNVAIRMSDKRLDVLPKLNKLKKRLGNKLVTQL